MSKMKWTRYGDGNYLSKDGQFWIHRFWYDDGDKTKLRTFWTLCVRSSSGNDWVAVDDVYGFSAAKQLASTYEAGGK